MLCPRIAARMSLLPVFPPSSLPSSLLPFFPSSPQAAILLTLGLQQREVSDLQAELGLPSNQVLALFNKAIRKLHGHLRAVKEAAVDRQLPRPPPRAAPAATAAAAAGGCLCVQCDSSHSSAVQCPPLPACLLLHLHTDTCGTTCLLCVACLLPDVCLLPPGASAPLLGEGVTVGLDEELDEAARQEREKMRAAFRPEDLAQYTIKGERAH